VQKEHPVTCCELHALFFFEITRLMSET
jgi:hypothetical protein